MSARSRMRQRCRITRRTANGVDGNYQPVLVESVDYEVPCRAWVRRTRYLTGEGVEAGKQFWVVHLPVAVAAPTVDDTIEVDGYNLRVTGSRPFQGHTQIDCEAL